MSTLGGTNVSMSAPNNNTDQELFMGFVVKNPGSNYTNDTMYFIISDIGISLYNLTRGSQVWRIDA